MHRIVNLFRSHNYDTNVYRDDLKETLHIQADKLDHRESEQLKYLLTKYKDDSWSIDITKDNITMRFVYRYYKDVYDFVYIALESYVRTLQTK